MHHQIWKGSDDEGFALDTSGAVFGFEICFGGITRFFVEGALWPIVLVVANPFFDVGFLNGCQCCALCVVCCVLCIVCCVLCVVCCVLCCVCVESRQTEKVLCGCCAFEPIHTQKQISMKS